MSNFSDLNLSKPLSHALADMGLQAPTPIQEKAFPVIMSGRDAVVIAQTGTGKTLSYLLPVIRQLTHSEQRHPRVLIVVPTRELVVQVTEAAKQLGRYTSLRCVGIYGASNINIQKQQVYDGVDILVGTPGRIIDLTLSRTLQFSGVKKLVVDEVDEMIGLGFRPQLVQILDKLPPRRQNLLFSATLAEEAEELIDKYFNAPEYVELISRGTPLEKIVQQAYYIPNFYSKVNLLLSLLNHNHDMQRVLVFVKNKKIADELEKELIPDLAGQLGVIHSNRSQPQRFNAVKQFQEGTHRVLIATDLIARGLDIKDVTHVVSFDAPKDAAAYIHRMGRTGRADKDGSAIIFLTEKDLNVQQDIETLMKKELPVLDLPKDVEISDVLTKDERPVLRDKNIHKNQKKGAGQFEPGSAFHEKKAKNKKEQLGGKRKQETQRRTMAKIRKKRGF